TAFMPGGGVALPGLHNTGINTLYYQTVALISQARASAAPPGKNSRRGAVLCRAAAMPCPAYRRQALIHRNINRLHRYHRPVQAQRRRATDIRHRTRPFAGQWQIRSRYLQTNARPAP
ncbi:hypothetical protein ACYA0D_21945, partial [Klebsiella pneumoniae]